MKGARDRALTRVRPLLNRPSTVQGALPRIGVAIYEINSVANFRTYLFSACLLKVKASWCLLCA